MFGRRAASISLVGALALGLGLSGCTLGAEIATLIPYAPSDGVQTETGDIKVRNALAYSEDGTEASLIMSVFNSGEEDLDVSFQYENASGEQVNAVVSVAAKSNVSVGNEGEKQVVLSDLDVALGSLLPVYVQYGTEPGVELLVPVVSPDSREYEGLLPTSTPTPTASPTPGAPGEEEEAGEPGEPGDAGESTEPTEPSAEQEG